MRASRRLLIALLACALLAACSDASGESTTSAGSPTTIPVTGPTGAPSTTGVITTVAGNGTFDYSDDGGAATAARLAYPLDVAVDAAGNVLVTGESYGTPDTDFDYATIKYAPDGRELWATRYDGLASLDDAADHVEHALRVMGTGAVGIGSDYDGARRFPVGLEHVGKLPGLAARLIERGWREEELTGFLGGNLLDYFKRVLG